MTKQEKISLQLSETRSRPVSPCLRQDTTADLHIRHGRWSSHLFRNHSCVDPSPLLRVQRPLMVFINDPPLGETTLIILVLRSFALKTHVGDLAQRNQQRQAASLPLFNFCFA